MKNDARLTQALNSFYEILKEEADDHCTAITIFFNCQGYEIKSHVRKPDSLKRDGISMKNLRGEWIE